MKIPTDTLILVIDGRKSLFMRNIGTALAPKFSVEQREETESPPTRELLSDAPGRSFTRFSPRRSAMDEVDAHHQEEERFAATIATRLRERVLANDFGSLIVVAPPRTLGVLRAHYDPMVKARLLGEVPKDLTGHPISEIEGLLGG